MDSKLNRFAAASSEIDRQQLAAELIITNRELVFQNEEKEKLAAELVIANRELTYQNEEKEKRAAELVIANRELVFQNEEKEKRAAELAIANKELLEAKESIRRLNEEDFRRLNKELEQKVLERTAQLEIANSELESFSYSVSHDLRAPLRAVNGFAMILEEDYSHLLDNEGKRLLKIIKGNADKMGMLIDDLLAFSRLGKKEIKKSVVDMTELANNALAGLTMGVALKAEVEIGTLYPVLADRTLMNQVWENLLSNAIKYSRNKENPLVKLQSEKKDQEIIYSIADNGAGFDMQYAHKLFGVFQRLHDADDFEGTGVGLALVHKIITRHGGKIWANAAVSEGATFYFSLPVALNKEKNG